MAFYLGIDGGGTKTKFLLGDEECIRAEASTEGSNILRSGQDAVRDALLRGIDDVCTSAGITQDDISRVVAGIAGSSNEEVRVALEEILRERFSGAITILGDMVISHYAALEGKPGVLVNAGTGSIAYGRNAKDETARAGGWGFAISDEGSGHWIGRLAIATAMRSFDAGVHHDFVHHLVTALGVGRPEELAKFANSTANPDFAQIFPAVVSIAELGDEKAQLILRNAGEELALLAETVLRQLFGEGDTPSVAASGGVFRNAITVFEGFKSQLLARYREARISLTDADPAIGALMLARVPR